MIIQGINENMAVTNISKNWLKRTMLLKWQETRSNLPHLPSSGGFSSDSPYLLSPVHDICVLLAIHVCLLFVFER